MVLHIPLTRGLVALISDEDEAVVSGRAWHAKPACQARANFYACRGGRGDEPKTVYLHRLIMGAGDGVEVDHVSGDGLDNRRENLRLCNRAENTINCTRRVAASGYRGVYRYNKHWRAQIQVRGENVRLGQFDDPALAAAAYDTAAIRFFGDFARLNFPVGNMRAAA